MEVSKSDAPSFQVNGSEGNKKQLKQTNSSLRCFLFCFFAVYCSLRSVKLQKSQIWKFYTVNHNDLGQWKKDAFFILQQTKRKYTKQFVFYMFSTVSVTHVEPTKLRDHISLTMHVKQYLSISCNINTNLNPVDFMLLLPWGTTTQDVTTVTKQLPSGFRD